MLSFIDTRKGSDNQRTRRNFRQSLRSEPVPSKPRTFTHTFFHTNGASESLPQKRVLLAYGPFMPAQVNISKTPSTPPLLQIISDLTPWDARLDLLELGLKDLKRGIGADS